MTGIRAVLTKMMALVLVSAGLAFCANQFGIHRILWVQDWARHVEQLAKDDGIRVVTLFEVIKAFDESSAQFVDARQLNAFIKGHVPGSVNVPLRDVEAQLALLEEGRDLIVYCDGSSCDDALNLCRELQANGCENLALFSDGIEVWMRFDQPLKQGPNS